MRNTSQKKACASLAFRKINVVIDIALYDY